MLQTLWKTVWQFFKKLNTELPYDPAIPLLGNIPKGMENRNSNRYFYICVHSSIIHNSQKVETTQVSIGECINKLWHIYIMGYHSTIKRNEVLIHATT